MADARFVPTISPETIGPSLVVDAEPVFPLVSKSLGYERVTRPPSGWRRWLGTLAGIALMDFMLVMICKTMFDGMLPFGVVVLSICLLLGWAGEWLRKNGPFFQD